jgi:hypothetical protein
MDTLVGTDRRKIYVYSKDKDSARFSLGFIEVGMNRGDYVPDFNGANGKVYRWVAPLNGIAQGNHEPATFLVTPKKQQLFTDGAVYSLSDKTTINTEIAMSNYDVNAFQRETKAIIQVWR